MPVSSSSTAIPFLLKDELSDENDDDEVSVDIEIPENEDDTERTDCSPNITIEEIRQSSLPRNLQEDEAEDADDEKRSESSSSGGDEGYAEYDDEDEEHEGHDFGSSKAPKARSRILSIGKNKLKSLSGRRSRSKSLESKRKVIIKEGASDGLDSSWRASFSRDRKRRDSMQKDCQAPFSPTSQQQQNQHQQPQQNQQINSKEQQSNSSIFRYIRSWGREKAIIDPPVEEQNHHVLPAPPSLGVSRANSGPIPTSFEHFGTNFSMTLASPLSSIRQRSSSTSNVRAGGGPISTSPNNNAVSPQAPGSPHEKQKSLKDQLLSQIQQQKFKTSFLSFGESSPKLGCAELSSDNDSAMDGHDDDDANLDDDNEDSTFASWEVVSDDDTDDIEEMVGWDTMPALPNRFCHMSATTEHQPQPKSIHYTNSIVPVVGTSNTIVPYGPPNYLDASALTTNVTRQLANQFVREHLVLLQAVLQLLAERDQVGVEGSMDSADNIWKKGPLRKLSSTQLMVRRKSNHKRPVVGGVWKVRYVELRQGNLSYYEDSGDDTSRKTIHLRQADTIVKDSVYAENKRGQQPPGYCFEVLVQGSPTSIWMASSEEERQAWVRAIKSAMIGEDATTNNTPRKSLDLTPYQESLRVYTSLRESLQLAQNQDMYLAAIHVAMKEVASLQVPVEWVREQIEQELSPLLLGTMKPPKFNRSPQKALKSSLSEFWRNMKETTFSINGLTVPRRSHLASERVVGALTRSILEFDKSFFDINKPDDDDPGTSHISELQAVSYARNILLAILRSKERQDAACAAKYLLETAGLVVLDKIPKQDAINSNIDELVYIEVSFAGADLSDDFLPDAEEMSGWVMSRTRRRLQTSIAVSSSKPRYTRTFAVLSGALLSYYEASSPRPHGLRGQLALVQGSTVRDEGQEQIHETTNKSEIDNSPDARFILSISTPGHQDRLLAFESQADVDAWKEAIQAAIESAGSLKNPPRVVTTTTTRPTLPGKMMLAKGAERAIMVAEAGTKQGIRAIKGAKDIGIRAIKTSTDGGIKVIRGAVGMLLPSKGDADEAGKGRRRFLRRVSKRPSLQMLLNNAIVHGRREPSVQCVVQTMQTFYIRDPNSTEHGTEHSSENDASNQTNPNREGWMTIQAKIYQAFVMSGGPSGRIARGVALVEIDFVETNVGGGDLVDDDDDDDLVDVNGSMNKNCNKNSFLHECDQNNELT
jgi:PH domain